MNRISRLFLSLALFAVIGITSYAADATKSPPLDLKGTRILVCAGYFLDMTGIPCLRKLTDAGAEVRHIRRAELTWELVQQYHLIIYIFDQGREKTKPGAEGPDEVLQKFVKAGGGVIFIQTGFESKEDINQSLAPFGASLLKEYLQDPRNAFTNTSAFFHLPYAYTENIAADNPVTDGVKGIWYDVDLAGGLHTSSIDVFKDWTTLVSGDKSATTIRIEGSIIQGHQSEMQQRILGKYTTSPPIIAAREFDAGAIVFMGLNGVEIFYGQGLPHYGNVVMEKGDGLRKSDFGRLYENALVWLAQHGKKATELGKGDLKPKAKEEEAKRINWSQDMLAGQKCTKPIKGVIGLHSTLSDGRATPEALIAKAKASGLQWVAFTEKLESFANDKWNRRSIKAELIASAGERTEVNSPDKWEQLRKICKDATTEDFVALPGLEYAIITGERWVVFGDFEWPEEKVFSTDRNSIIVQGWWLTVACVPNGPYNAGKSKLRPWDYQLYNMWPIRTTLAGKQTDEAFPGFAYLQGVQDGPSPMAVDMVYDEQELGAAAGRMCNYLTLDKPGDLNKFFKANGHGGGSYLEFVSDGPVITDWRQYNACRDSHPKWFLPSTEQYRVKLSVESKVPINDIKIYDGQTLFRRYCPKQPQVTVTIDIPHDKQRSLFAVITDAEGRQAVIGGHNTRDMLNWRSMCSDRKNSICCAIITDDAGSYLTSPTAPYQNKMYSVGVFSGYPDRHFMISPPGVDGGMRPITMAITPSIFYQFTLDSKQPKMWPEPEIRMEIPVCSRDGILQEDTVTGYFTSNDRTFLATPIDLKDILINYRYLNITPRAGDPGVILLEGSFVFNKTTNIKGQALQIFSSAIVSKPGEGDHYAMVTPEVTMAGQHNSSNSGMEARMKPGSYAMLFPAQLGSTGAMALDEGYSVSVSDGARTRIAVWVDKAGDMKGGDEIRYRLLLMHGRLNELPNTYDWENFANKMGLRGKAAYEVKDIKAGKVKGTKFLLEIEPSDGGFAGTVTSADLPIRLPIRVADMNPNWTFAYFDLDRKEWLPSAVDQVISQGYFTLDTRRGNHRIFAGHPVLADNKELQILVLSDGLSKIQASVNNVGDAAMDTIVRLNPALGKAEPVKIHLESGEVNNLDFSFVP